MGLGYWDGNAWTGHRSVPAAPVPVAIAVPAGGDAGSQQHAGLAVAAAVLGLVGVLAGGLSVILESVFFTLAGVTAVIALVLGGIALTGPRSPSAPKPHALAIAGLALGVVGLALSIWGWQRFTSDVVNSFTTPFEWFDESYGPSGSDERRLRPD